MTGAAFTPILHVAHFSRARASLFAPSHLAGMPFSKEIAARIKQFERRYATTVQVL
jgi:hypothetical protein